MAAIWSSVSTHGCIQARPGPDWKQLTFFSNVSDIIYLLGLLNASGVGVLELGMFVVTPKTMPVMFAGGVLWAPGLLSWGVLYLSGNIIWLVRALPCGKEFVKTSWSKMS